MRTVVFLVSAVALAALACTSGSDVDVERERAALLQADRDFAIETAERGADGWADWFHSEGVMFPKVGKVEGREAIRERMRPVFTAGSPLLTWEPETAVVAASGDLGYTVGRWSVMAKNPDGVEEALSTGNYVSIWRKNADGAWRVAVDIGNEDVASEPPDGP